MSVEARAKAAGKAHRSAMIARHRAWWIGFLTTMLTPISMFLDEIWLTTGFFSLAIMALFRVNLMQARMDRAKATLSVLAAFESNPPPSPMGGENRPKGESDE